MPYCSTPEKVAALRIVPKAREANGRKQRPTTVIARQDESKDKLMSVVRNQPHRRDMKDPDDPKLGDALGRLLREGAVDHEQYTAGQRWQIIHERHGRQVTGAKFTIPPQTVDGSGGKSCSAEPDEKTIADTRTEWSMANFALEETGNWRSCYKALTFVCTLGHYPRMLETRADLKQGLSALHRLWKC